MRIVADARLQTVAHQRAAEACLGELAGEGPSPWSLATLSRARYHAERARTCATMAVRINRDRDAGLVMAALLETCERLLLAIDARWSNITSEVDEDLDPFEVEVVRHLAQASTEHRSA